MRLMESIIAANHAAVEGRSGVAHFDCHAECLPLAVLTCIDPRLNKLFPGALGLKDEQFIWLRNAGNVITSPTSSTVRSIAVAVLLKNAREIAIIGHTDCKMSKFGVADLLDRLKAWGVERTALPMPNLQEFFGLFASEKPNVMKAVGHLRSSPIIPQKIPVHGLLIDTSTGRLDWVVNGYEAPSTSQTMEAGITLKELVSEALPQNVSGYVSGPLKNLVEKVEPLLEKRWEAMTEKVAEKVAEKLKIPAKPSAAPPPLMPPPVRREPGKPHGPAPKAPSPRSKSTPGW